MSTSQQPLGAPAMRRIPEKRRFTGPIGWDADRRIDDLALVCRIDAKVTERRRRRLGTRERITVRACGKPADLDRFWRRLTEAIGPPPSRSLPWWPPLDWFSR